MKWVSTWQHMLTFYSCWQGKQPRQDIRSNIVMTCDANKSWGMIEGKFLQIPWEVEGYHLLLQWSNFEHTALFMCTVLNLSSTHVCFLRLVLSTGHSINLYHRPCCDYEDLDSRCNPASSLNTGVSWQEADHMELQPSVLPQHRCFLAGSWSHGTSTDSCILTLSLVKATKSHTSSSLVPRITTQLT